MLADRPDGAFFWQTIVFPVMRIDSVEIYLDRLTNLAELVVEVRVRLFLAFH